MFSAQNEMDLQPKDGTFIFTGSSGRHSLTNSIRKFLHVLITGYPFKSCNCLKSCEIQYPEADAGKQSNGKHADQDL